MLPFWILAFAIAWALTLPPAVAQMGLIAAPPYPWQVGILIGLAPAIAAMVASAREGGAKRFLGETMRLRGPVAVYVTAIALPFVALAVAYLTNAQIPIGVDSSLAAFALLWLVLALGEEIGWRGFALPRLTERWGFWKASSILGLLWCVWHFPRLLGSPFVSSFSDAAPLIGAFSVQILLANFILCWLYFRAGRTILAPTLFHALMNVVATAYFMAATDWAITAFLALVVAAIAFAERGFLGSVRESRHEGG